MSYYSDTYRDHVRRENILLNETDGIEYQTRGARAEIMPGHLVAYDGEDGAVPHGDDGGYATARFALEADQWEKTIRDPILEEEEVTIAFGKGGTRFLAFLANGESVSSDDPLVSAGDGTLRAFDSEADDSEAIVAHAHEDVDNSAGDGPERVAVEC